MTAGWRGRCENKVPFGLKDGRLHFVTQVDTGLACGCFCPDPRCNQPLIARNRPSPDRKRAYHFMHAAESPGCAGRESALHRMAKEVLLHAASVEVPAWEGPALTVPSGRLTIAAQSAIEVPLLDGRIRPDVRLSGLVDAFPLAPLFVEVRVHHAVDSETAALVRAVRLSMLEIDLSDVSDEDVVDPAAFERVVLHEVANRRWIHLDAPAYMAGRSGEYIFDVRDSEDFRFDIPTRSGGSLIVRKQRAILYRGSEPPAPIDFELPSFVEPGGQRVDGFGNNVPYAPGLYVRHHARQHAHWDRSHAYRTFLTPLRLPDPYPQARLF